MFGSAHNPQQGGKAPLKALRLGNNHLDFRDFGDVIGIMQVRRLELSVQTRQQWILLPKHARDTQQTSCAG